MADEEGTAMDRLRERLGGLERGFDRLDERMVGKLGKDDANRLMEYSVAGDNRLREDVGGRINDFRVEVREAFKHGEREHTAALYKSSTESEARIGKQISDLANAMSSLTSQLTALTADVAALASSPEKSRGMHPLYTLLGGTGLGGTLLYLVLVALGFLPRPGG